MTTKRVPINRPPVAEINDETVDLFRRALALGRRHPQYSDVKRQLARALGRSAPWLLSPLDVTANTNPNPGFHQLADIPGAVRLRKALERHWRSLSDFR
jgi:hypothetical protein